MIEEYEKELKKLLDDGKISKTVSDFIIKKVDILGKSPYWIYEEYGLQRTGPPEIAKGFEEIIKNDEARWKEFIEGNTKLLGFFIGKLMQAMQGSIDPFLARRFVIEKMELK